MSEPFDKALLERLQSLPCATLENLAQQQQIMQTMLSQFYNSNVLFALSANVDLNELVAYEEKRRLIAGVVMWAISTGVVTQPTAGSAGVGYVFGKRCANIKGEDPEVVAERFFFRGSPTLTIGTVFPYLFDENGLRVVAGTGGGGSGTYWAVTQSTPTGGMPPVVSVRLCADATGAGVTGTAFDVLLPSRASTAYDLPAGSVISFTVASDNTNVIESDYSCATYYQEGVLSGVEPILNFVDTATVEWTITDVPGSRWVKVEAEAIFDPEDTQAGEVEFTLTADMSGGSATASVQRYYGSERDIVNPGTPITVYDGQDLYTFARTGAKGKASYDKTNNKYWISNCQQECIMGIGKLAGNLATTDSSIGLEDVSGWNMNPFIQQPESEILASNSLEFEGLAGTYVIWARDGNGYRIINVACS